MYRISKAETGKKIRKLMNHYGISVREVQEEMGLESPQAVYKWLNAKTIPSTENLLILARLFHVSIEELIVLESESEEKEEDDWERKHPDIFMAYKVWGKESVRQMDSQRLEHFIEDLMEERIRTASERSVDNEEEKSKKMKSGEP